jgi:hypothetical protein
MSESRIIAFGYDSTSQTYFPLTVTSGALSVNATIVAPVTSAGFPMTPGVDTLNVTSVTALLQESQTSSGFNAIVPARSNQGKQILTQTSRTGNITSSTITNYNWVGARFYIDVISLANPITPAINALIVGKGTFTALLTGTAIAVASTVTLDVSPFIPTVATSVAQNHLPAFFNVSLTTTGTYTAAVYADYYIV